MEIVLPEGYSSLDLDKKEGAEVNCLVQNATTPIPDRDGWLDEELKRHVIVTSLDMILNLGRKYSLWPANFGTACCVFELAALAMSRFDISRFGMELLRASPRQADMMIVAGTITWKMAPQVVRIYEQMPEPKWVLAMGACSISGGTFSESYAVVPGVNRILPVDAYIPGCPPRPEALMYGIQKIHDKIMKDSITRKQWREVK